MGTRRLRLVALAVGTIALPLTLLAGCSGGTATLGGSLTAPGPSASSGAEGDPTEEDFDAVTALLDQRAAAARDGDARAFLATVDPQQPRLRRQQRVLFGNLARLDVSQMSYVVDRETLVVAAPVRGDAPTFRPLVDEYVELEGTLDGPLVNPVQMTFVRRGSRWYVGAENQRKVTGSAESPQERPWFGGPIAVRRSGAMTVVVDRDRAGTLDQLVAQVRADIDYAARVVDERPTYDVLVDATSNGLAIGFSHLTKQTAAAVSFPLRGRAGRLVGSAVKLNPRQVEQALAQQGLMRHELTHYLLEEYSATSPTWLVEGIASYVQYHPNDFSRLQVDRDYYDRLIAADRRLPIAGLFSTDPAVNYPLSQAAVTWLVDRAGVGRLKQLMRAYRAAHDGPRVDELTPRLLRRVYGVREADVVEGAFDELSQLNR